MSNLNRRTALTAVAALPALAVPAAAVAAADSPDAELIAIGREFDRLVLMNNDYWYRYEEAFERAEAMMPPVPDSLRPKVGDRKAGLRRPNDISVDDGLYGYGDMSHIRKIDHPRAREVARDYDEWAATRELAYEASGFAAIEDEHNDAALEDIYSRIADLPALTIEGLQVKARVTFWCCLGKMEDREGEGRDVAFAMSVVKDLLRMQGISPCANDHEYAAKYHRPLA
jgi:hypothetical protein